MAEQEYGKGYVYILTNPSMPGLVKIGKTTRNSQTRAREISSGTGVPTPYKVAHERWVVDCHAAEREIHAELTRQRRNKNREFFKLKLDEAIEIVDEICDKYSTNEAVISLPLRNQVEPNNNTQTQVIIPSNEKLNLNNNTGNYITEFTLFPLTDKPENKDKVEKPDIGGCFGCLALLFVCITCSYFVYMYPNSAVVEEISATPQPLLAVTYQLLPSSTATIEIPPAPTVEIAPTPTLYNEAENPPKDTQIVWSYELKDLTANKSRWDIWKEVVEAKVQGHMSWNEFNEQVFLHNPNLTEDKSYFHPNEVYVLPQLK